MCPWVGSHGPSCGRQYWRLPSCMEYLWPQGGLLPRVYGTTASPLWLELRGPAAWQATPSWAVCWHACHSKKKCFSNALGFTLAVLEML